MGEAARNLFADAQAMLKQIIAEKWLTAKAVVGLFPANSVNGDDVEVYSDESRTRVLTTFRYLRQQMIKPEDRANHCLGDLVAPKETGVKDYLGCFAVTAGIGIDPLVEAFEAKHDDYNAIMLKALADRLAEAFAELMHLQVRKELWAYAPDESLSVEELIDEKYRGIRPAPGYPACPDHTEKGPLFDLLGATAKRRHDLDREFRHVADGGCQRILFLPPAVALFRRGQDRSGSGRRVRAAQRHGAGGRGALACARARI